MYYVVCTLTDNYINLGGTAGAAALITEQLGQVVAALSFDSEYKRVCLFAFWLLYVLLFWLKNM